MMGEIDAGEKMRKKRRSGRGATSVYFLHKRPCCVHLSIFRVICVICTLHIVVSKFGFIGAIII